MKQAEGDKRNFNKILRASLKGETRDRCLITSENYEVDNTYEVKIFFENWRSLVSESLNEEDIETTKTCLQETKKPRSLKIENYIRRLTILNNYIPRM